MRVPDHQPERENPLGVYRKTWTHAAPSLGCSMPVARWGDYGLPVLLFPTAGGDFLECERFLMIRVLSPLIAARRICVFACGSVSSDGWMNHSVPPQQRAQLQERFDQYLAGQLLPFIREQCGGFPTVIGAGASLGAYNAVNAACRHPQSFSKVIAMSGTFDFDKWQTKWEGYRPDQDQTYYFHQPLRFVPGLRGSLRDAIRKVEFLIATGRGRWEEPAQSERLARVLQQQGVPAQLELWGRDCDHDWPTWRTMLPMFLDKLVP